MLSGNRYPQHGRVSLRVSPALPDVAPRRHVAEC